MSHPAPTLQLQLSQTFRANQTKVGSAAGIMAASLWDKSFEIGSARASWARMRPQLLRIADRFYTGDTAAGQRYYNACRIVYGLKPWNGQISVKLRADHAGQTLDSTGLGWFLHMVKGGSQMMDASTSARGVLSAAMSDLVMQGARDWITAASKADPASNGWNRITSGTCDWCEERAANGPTTEDGEWHNYCLCTAEPSFSSDSQPDDPGVSAGDLMDLSRSLGSSAAPDAADDAIDDAIDDAPDVTSNLSSSQALAKLRQWVQAGSLAAGGKQDNGNH